MNGGDLRPFSHRDRFDSLSMLVSQAHQSLRPVAMATTPADKSALFEELRRTSREGVVFKELSAPFTPGRSSSGGSQLKHKFVESASFVVLGSNARRSVALGLYADGKLVPAGSVTIPPNEEVPAAEEVVEVRYLYAFRESGCVYQPVYLGKRSDIPAAECGVEQLKYKPETTAAA